MFPSFLKYYHIFNASLVEVFSAKSLLEPTNADLLLGGTLGANIIDMNAN